MTGPAVSAVLLAGAQRAGHTLPDSAGALPSAGGFSVTTGSAVSVLTGLRQS